MVRFLSICATERSGGTRPNSCHSDVASGPLEANPFKTVLMRHSALVRGRLHVLETTCRSRESLGSGIERIRTLALLARASNAARYAWCPERVVSGPKSATSASGQGMLARDTVFSVHSAPNDDAPHCTPTSRAWGRSATGRTPAALRYSSWKSKGGPPRAVCRRSPLHLQKRCLALRPGAEPTRERLLICISLTLAGRSMWPVTSGISSCSTSSRSRSSLISPRASARLL